MKETYTRPTVSNSDIAGNSDGVIPAMVGMAVGYAAGRAITKAVKAAPSIQLPSLQNRKA